MKLFICRIGAVLFGFFILFSCFWLAGDSHGEYQFIVYLVMWAMCPPLNLIAFFGFRALWTGDFSIE